MGTPPGQAGPGALRPEAPKSPDHPKGTQYPYRSPARDRAGTHVAGLDLRRFPTGPPTDHDRPPAPLGGHPHPFRPKERETARKGQPVLCQLLFFCAIAEKPVKKCGLFCARINCSSAATGRKTDRGGGRLCRQKRNSLRSFREQVHREGAQALLDYLSNKSDFSPPRPRPGSTGAYAGGLCEHSLNVYHCLKDYLARERVTDLYVLGTARSPSPWWPSSTTCARSFATSPPPAT